MDLNAMLLEEHRETYVAALADSRRMYHAGTGSPVVAIIGRGAALLRRAAAGVEGWSHGTADAVIQRHVSVR